MKSCDLKLNGVLPNTLFKRAIILLVIICIALFAIGAVNGADINKTNATNEGGIKKAITDVGNGETIYLASGNYNGVNNTGLTISKALTIEGSVNGKSIIDGRGNNRLFTINTGSSKVIFKNIHFINGYGTDKNGYGGAIYNNKSTLEFYNCNFSGNIAKNSGGAIYSTGGKLNIFNSSFTSNRIQGYAGGAIYSVDGDQLSISDSIFLNNFGGEHGGAIASYSGYTKIINSTFQSNTANYLGGALKNFATYSFEVINSTLTNNNAGTGNTVDGSLEYDGAITFKNTYINGVLVAGEEENIKFPEFNYSNEFNISKSYIDGFNVIVELSNGSKYNYIIEGVDVSHNANGINWESFYKSDLAKLKFLGANSIKTYQKLAIYNTDGTINYEKTLELLNYFSKNGISITMGFTLDDIINKNYKQYLNYFANHPAILMWVLGNENNFFYGNSEYFGTTNESIGKSRWFSNLTSAVSDFKQLSPNKIISVVHGLVPSPTEYDEYLAINDLDLVMVNLYVKDTFGNRFSEWSSTVGQTNKSMPLIFTEYGRASKYNNGTNSTDLQNTVVTKLIEEITLNLNTNNGVSAGSFIFELSDEDWKPLITDNDEAADIIWHDRHLGLFTDDLNPKTAAKPVAYSVSNLWNGNSSITFIDDSDTTAPIVNNNRPGGTYNSTISVTLSINEKGTIYYTNDGSVPSKSSSVYNSPLAISKNTTLKYFAVDTAGNPSDIFTCTYIIKKEVNDEIANKINPTLVLSLNTASSKYNNLVKINLRSNVQNGKIYFYAGGKYIGHKYTNDKGIAIFSYTTKTISNKLIIQAKFNGNDKFNSKYSNKKTLKVTKDTPKLTLTINKVKNRYVYKYKSKVTINAKLIDSNKKAIKGLNFYLYANSMKLMKKTLNKYGKLTFKGYASAKGTFKVYLKFNGNKYYNAVKSNTITVKVR
ncbi:MAG: chitobiase/beta-hexosaminidase C-terminal domain-containing protein [Methanobrevibacter sp.]|nr:chitobiase/beta-hexosaminidase C-terminal domain-containing protein [Candidatus Methanoflexus mossambicus]